MELTQQYKHTRLTPNAVGHRLSTFVNNNKAVFEALSRVGSPFGGNVAPAQTSRPATASESMAPPTEHVIGEPLVHLQRQLDQLSRTVAQLNRQLEHIQRATASQPGETGRPTKLIGINRFRALRAQS
ncbi:hypothetical protein F5984_00990 [Rudanella paleaurantiibacter]|uniref:Uncharacterized protein n=1 Tax=Rudanella paleaurantiibacter TaxID=2614655 RepID=A0A7J5U4D7_9BACT|nr:hypothetical protein [Rudanella paleaurantiibacter]KAB7732563.1 hypothetical protein F5984_00990 [Rudanella paleaurantiibacter]